MTTKHELIREVKALEEELAGADLEPDELDQISTTVDELRKALKPLAAPLTFRDLKGVGKEVWQDIDVGAYIREERRSWR